MRSQAVVQKTSSSREVVLRWQRVISDIALATGAFGFSILYYLLLFS